MNDRKVSVNLIAATVCWIVGFIGAVVNVFVAPDISMVAGAFLTAGACFTVRSSVHNHAAATSQAFRLGREAERRQHEVDGGRLRGV